MEWYKQYAELNSASFIVENSGNFLHLPPPYRLVEVDGEIAQIAGKYGLDKAWRVLGYTEHLPFLARYEAVGIMFEDTGNFEQVWWHYPIKWE
jgi:hypothetical protein